MQAHFVEFLSPGTFFAETSEYKIDKWDVEKAKKLAKKVVERYNATPYGFRFITRSRTAKDLDSKVTKTSGTYFLGGEILTLAQVKKAMPHEKILISNMEGNRWDKVVINDNSWRTIQPFQKGDKLLTYTPPKRKK